MFKPTDNKDRLISRKRNRRVKYEIVDHIKLCVSSILNYEIVKPFSVSFAPSKVNYGNDHNDYNHNTGNSSTCYYNVI